MYNIAITAGGTSEDVDGVRKLTNVSTGSLGWNCLEAVLRYFSSIGENDYHIYYILTPTAYRKDIDKKFLNNVDFIDVTDAESVYNVVNKLTREIKITHFIHSMAISDFTFSFAVSFDALANEITEYIKEGGNVDSNKIKELISLPQSRYSEGEKISSSEPLMIGLKKTKKVISLIKSNNHNTILVGFKLLRNVGEETLIDVANELKRKNECDFVFANELSKIEGDNHSGMLIRDGEILERPKGKANIADVIVKNILTYK